MQKTKKLVAFMLTLAVILTLIPSVPAQAASKKATLSATSMTIPIGTLKSGMSWYTGDGYPEEAQKLTVTNKVSGATYTFTSSNTKVVKIAKSGGYPTGVKAGSATITCKQTLKGKTTTVGTCKVKVKAAKLYKGTFWGPWFRWNKDEICIGTTAIFSYLGNFGIQYRNAGATYKYVCDKSGLTLKDIKWTYAQNQAVDENSIQYNGQLLWNKGGAWYGTKVTAKKAGTYTVTVKETYKKKTRTIGTFKVTVYDPTVVKSDVEVNVGREVGIESLVEHVYEHDYSNYKAEVVEGTDLLQMKPDEDGYYYGRALAAGTVKIKVTEKATGTELGTVTVKLKEIPCTGIKTEDIATYVGDDKVWLSYYCNPEPWDATDSWSVSCDNEDIFKLGYYDDGYDDGYEYYYRNNYYGEAVSAGETEVTVTCGSQTATIRVVVYADEAAYHAAGY